MGFKKKQHGIKTKIVFHLVSNVLAFLKWNTLYVGQSMKMCDRSPFFARSEKAA